MEKRWWLFAKEKLEIKIQTKPLWLSILCSKFLQTCKNKVQNDCEVSVTFHVYKHEDKKNLFCSKEAEYTLSFGIDIWRQLDSAENNKMKQKIETLK